MSSPVKRIGDIGAPWPPSSNWSEPHDVEHASRSTLPASLVPDLPDAQTAPEEGVDFGEEFRRQYEIWQREHAPRRLLASEDPPLHEHVRLGYARALRIALIAGGAALTAFYFVGILPNLDGSRFRETATPAAVAKGPKLADARTGAPVPPPSPWPAATVPAVVPQAVLVAPVTQQPEPLEPAASETGKTVAADPEEIERMLRRGEDFIKTGDLAAARLVLRRAVSARDARAAFALGSTYDPAVLDKLPVYGAGADLELAIMWYERAKQYGSKDAALRLHALAQRLP